MNSPAKPRAPRHVREALRQALLALDPERGHMAAETARALRDANRSYYLDSWVRPRIERALRWADGSGDGRPR